MEIVANSYASISCHYHHWRCHFKCLETTYLECQFNLVEFPRICRSSYKNRGCFYRNIPIHCEDSCCGTVGILHRKTSEVAQGLKTTCSVGNVQGVTRSGALHNCTDERNVILDCQPCNNCIPFWVQTRKRSWSIVSRESLPSTNEVD